MTAVCIFLDCIFCGERKCAVKYRSIAVDLVAERIDCFVKSDPAVIGDIGYAAVAAVNRTEVNYLIFSGGNVNVVGNKCIEAVSAKFSISRRSFGNFFEFGNSEITDYDVVVSLVELDRSFFENSYGTVEYFVARCIICFSGGVLTVFKSGKFDRNKFFSANADRDLIAAVSYGEFRICTGIKTFRTRKGESRGIAVFAVVTERDTDIIAKGAISCAEDINCNTYRLLSRTRNTESSAVHKVKPIVSAKAEAVVTVTLITEHLERSDIVGKRLYSAYDRRRVDPAAAVAKMESAILNSVSIPGFNLIGINRFAGKVCFKQFFTGFDVCSMAVSKRRNKQCSHHRDNDYDCHDFFHLGILLNNITFFRLLSKQWKSHPITTA